MAVGVADGVGVGVLVAVVDGATVGLGSALVLPPEQPAESTAAAAMIAMTDRRVFPRRMRGRVAKPQERGEGVVHKALNGWNRDGEVIVVKQDQSESRAKQPRELLAAERADTEAQIATLAQDLANMVAAAAESNADDEHDPEGTTLAFERAQVAALLEHEQVRLEEIDKALARVGDGTYGACANCGRPIGAERLAARPSASTCIDCARR